MRIFHLADLHIGKKLNHVSLMEDQQHVLNQIILAMVTQKPDVLVLAGDIYDRRNPSIEAIQLLDDFLSEVILVHHVPVLAIGGNHDSGERLGFASGILARTGLHMQGRLSLPVPQVVLADQWGEVVFHLLPYADLATIKYELGDDSLADYQTAMAKLLELVACEMESSQRHVLIAHGVVIGGEPLERSQSERDLTIGGTEYWESGLLNQFDYVALGHLHQQQRAGSERINYSGSMMKYSFSEEKQVKGILQVDLLEKGQVALQCIAITPLRDMVTLTGELAQLMNPLQGERDCSQHFIRAILTDSGELLDPMNTLKQVYPHILTLERANQPQAMAWDDGIVQGIDLQQQTPEQLFEQFYYYMTGEALDTSQLALMDQVFKQREVNG